MILGSDACAGLLRDAEALSPGSYRDAQGRVRYGALRRAVLDVLVAHPCGLRLGEVAQAIDREPQLTWKTLRDLRVDGRVRRLGRGLYAVAA